MWHSILQKALFFCAGLGKISLWRTVLCFCAEKGTVFYIHPARTHMFCWSQWNFNSLLLVSHWDLQKAMLYLHQTAVTLVGQRAVSLWLPLIHHGIRRWFVRPEKRHKKLQGKFQSFVVRHRAWWPDFFLSWHLMFFVCCLGGWEHMLSASTGPFDVYPSVIYTTDGLTHLFHSLS